MTGRVADDARPGANALAADGAAGAAIDGIVLPDPSGRLTAAFRAVAAGMRELALVNPALEVEAVGFALWERRWLGVMVTPWFMNLTLAPADPAAWQALAPGAKRRYRFPAGDYEFIGARDATVGDYQICSLFSPMERFEDHASARLVAQLARDALFDAANAEDPERPTANLSPAGARAGPLAQLDATLAEPLSKRDFLRGRFLPGERDDRG